MKKKMMPVMLLAVMTMMTMTTACSSDDPLSNDSIIYGDDNDSSEGSSSGKRAGCIGGILGHPLRCEPGRRALRAVRYERCRTDERQYFLYEGLQRIHRG